MLKRLAPSCDVGARRGWLAIVALALVLVPLATAPAEARPPVRGLVYETAASPVLCELRAQLGHKLRLAPVTRARLRRTRRYRLLVLDGHRLSPAALARRRRAIDRYMDRGGWVLALDVGPGHFAGTLDRLTRFNVGGAGRSSRAFLFRDAVVHGHPSALMLDAPSLGSVGAAAASAATHQGAADNQAAQVAYLMRARLLRPATGVDPPDPGEQDVPDYLQHRLWNLAVVPDPQQPPVVPAAWWNDDRKVWPVLGVPSPEPADGELGLEPQLGGLPRQRRGRPRRGLPRS
jgi:hypothetical protein